LCDYDVVLTSYEVLKDEVNYNKEHSYFLRSHTKDKENDKEKDKKFVSSFLILTILMSCADQIPDSCQARQTENPSFADLLVASGT
jgi:hypothetical protein